MTLQKLFAEFRKEVLKMTLKDMEIKTGVSLKTLSAFENGRSSNINHLQAYIQCCKNENEVESLLISIQSHINETLKEV